MALQWLWPGFGLWIALGALLLPVVVGAFYLAGLPIAMRCGLYHLPDNIPPLPISSTDLIALNQTSDALQQAVKDWIVSHKDIRYDELYRLVSTPRFMTVLGVRTISWTLRR
ncbi:hypothetical protein FE839_23630 [Klebsiella indica]|uniref:Uncharacterized protein n=1 Tax=Klebsiella indica TaxID=2582917 RepID=A0A5R9L8S7_9ENTR|nr:hypothetical protein [Klebsiella indica]TLV04883.1 hypothetical protein FE839_23630 [Klebsiella indica]